MVIPPLLRSGRLDNGYSRDESTPFGLLFCKQDGSVIPPDCGPCKLHPIGKDGDSGQTVPACGVVRVFPPAENNPILTARAAVGEGVSPKNPEKTCD
jgi:hypothetical protein